eukprot:CAMPEP_0119385278 /NCGR_PEP_ID=MMETSP1334-20130426/90386_1 /TAXON_ID=127549 /ORGANISM="Calcidiscus leptoporus, Strain RCC1130" /LENGTH=42 /DNA_ID= /DNA_START= /DNA_END= /DNA_ORIENTATION=
MSNVPEASAKVRMRSSLDRPVRKRTQVSGRQRLFHLPPLPLP